MDAMALWNKLFYIYSIMDHVVLLFILNAWLDLGSRVLSFMRVALAFLESSFCLKKYSTKHHTLKDTAFEVMHDY